MKPRAIIDDRYGTHPAFGLGSTSSVAFSGSNVETETTSTLLCVLAVDADCHIKVAGVAAVSDFLLVQNVYFFIRVVEGQKLNVISDGIDGTLYITNMV